MPAKRKRQDEIFKILRPHFGKALVLLRGTKSQESLAKSAGMDAGTLRRLEKGNAPLREDYISGILRSLEITLPDFLRTVADCCEKAETEGEPPHRRVPNEEIFRRLRKNHDARSRLDREALEIDIEIKRRQISVNRSDRGELS